MSAPINDGGPAFPFCTDFARELERENAALREQVENLGGENRRLRKVVAAPAMITWAMNGKEAQP